MLPILILNQIVLITSLLTCLIIQLYLTTHTSIWWLLKRFRTDTSNNTTLLTFTIFILASIGHVRWRCYAEAGFSVLERLLILLPMATMVTAAVATSSGWILLLKMLMVVARTSSTTCTSWMGNLDKCTLLLIVFCSKWLASVAYRLVVRGFLLVVFKLLEHRGWWWSWFRLSHCSIAILRDSIQTRFLVILIELLVIKVNFNLFFELESL